MNKIGIIGAGNMGGAIATALCENSIELTISNRSLDKLEKFKDYKNTKITKDNLEVVKNSKYIILAVKPNMYKSVIDEIKNEMTEDKVLISIAAGFSIKALEELLENRKIIMTMPNTPAMVEEAMTAICPNTLVSKDEVDEVVEIFNIFGRGAIIEESQFAAFAGACGCLPAYVYMFIESVADAAVLNGMKRADAYEFVSQTVLGSAKMVIETKKHPGELKDMVTSPGGTTIAGVQSLENHGFRGTIIDAIDCAVKKSMNMGK